MDPEIKKRLQRLSKEARKLRRLYGYEGCPNNLAVARDEILKALKERAIHVWESV